MSLRDFKSDTYKFWSKRDGAIAVIDAALQAAHNAPTVRARLLELQQAIQAFKDEKDEKHGTYLASKRNAKGAIDTLSDQVDIALAAPSPIHAQVRGPGNLAAQIQVGRENLRRPLPPVPYKTMTDDSVVTLFVNEAKAKAVGWNGRSKKQRGEQLFEAVKKVHTTCTIPVAGVEVKALDPGYMGFFDFDTWSLQLSEEMFDFTLPASGGVNKKFVYVCEILYHEARHCEQWFHMARLQANNYRTEADSLSDLWYTYGIKSYDACGKAWARQMKPNDQMYDLTRGWFKSVFGDGHRDIVLTGLALKQNDNMNGEQAERARGWGNGIHAQYKGSLPEEKDAWAIQDKVRAKFGAV